MLSKPWLRFDIKSNIVSLGRNDIRYIRTANSNNDHVSDEDDNENNNYHHHHHYYH